MKQILGIFTAIAISMNAYGKPMTGSVSSWEGDFSLNPTNISIHVADKPIVTLWLYELKSGSKGTALGFSNEDGDMILAPHPTEKGVQPIYQNHAVTFTITSNAEIVVIYKVQGNGGQTYVEKYEYDGKKISLMSKTLHGGRHDPIWRKQE
jgi:hypothetical protein